MIFSIVGAKHPSNSVEHDIEAASLKVMEKNHLYASLGSFAVNAGYGW
jgi:hypothetical protein